MAKMANMSYSYTRKIQTPGHGPLPPGRFSIFSAPMTRAITILNYRWKSNIQIELTTMCPGLIPHNPPLIEADVTKAEDELIGGSWTSIAFHTRVNRYSAGVNVSGKTTTIVFCLPG